jgi:hypothetical protein
MARASLRPNLPEFMIAPAPRCFHHEQNEIRTICGELATHVRKGTWWFDDQYFCDAHCQPGDELVAGDRVCLRLEFTVKVVLSGTSVSPILSRVEAMARLEAAIAAAGGLLDVESVRSAIGRYKPTSAPRRKAGDQAIPE